MKITILTIFPEMFQSVLNSSILGRAREQGLIEVECVDIRPFSDRKHKNTDDYPFGGGAGMVMLAQPIMDAMKHVTGEDFSGRRIYMGPRGTTLTTAKARELAKEEHLVLLCGHYEGVDQRALDSCIDEEISIGDYILTGGELAVPINRKIIALPVLERFTFFVRLENKRLTLTLKLVIFYLPILLSSLRTSLFIAIIIRNKMTDIALAYPRWKRTEL